VGTLTPEQKEFLSIARRNLEHLNQFLNRTLDFQKLESHGTAFHFEEADLCAAVREAAESFRPVAQAKGLSLELELTGAVPLVRFDRDRVVQVVRNLVDNAVKFTDAGRVTVSVLRGENIVVVTVGDTGPGVKEEDLARLFRPYERLDVPGKSRGTGLGLAACREILEAHRGKIWADSKPGEGSRFHFLLPIIERRIRGA
jgi:signal transduction histidine kinase